MQCRALFTISAVYGHFVTSCEYSVHLQSVLLYIHEFFDYVSCAVVKTWAQCVLVGECCCLFQKYLCSGLMVAKANLVELDLSDNAFGPNGMNGLTDFLRSSSCYSLRELRLNNNGLGIQGGKVGHHLFVYQIKL